MRRPLSNAGRNAGALTCVLESKIPTNRPIGDDDLCDSNLFSLMTVALLRASGPPSFLLSECA